MPRTFPKSLGSYMSLGVGSLGALLSGKSKISLHARIKLASSDTGANDNTILSVVTNAGTVGAVLSIDGTAGAPKVRISARSVSTDARQVKSGATTIASGAVAYVGGVIDIVGDSITVYKDGAADGTAAATFANTTWTLGTPTEADTIGGYKAPPTATTDQVNGEIGEIAIWGDALSAGNFLSLASGEAASAVRPDILLYYVKIGGTTSPELPTIGAPVGTITGSLPAVLPASLALDVLVEVELSGVGAGWTSLSTDVVTEEGVVVRRGIGGGGPNDRVASTGPASFTLRNDARNSGSKLGYYSLHHANKRSGWGLGIGCRIRLRDTISIPYTQCVGRIDAIDVAAGSEKRVRVTVVDWMDEAARWVLTPEVGEQVEKRGDEVLTAIVAEMPSQPTAKDFDAGSDVYPYALDTSSQVAALEEFGKLAASEFAFVYLTAAGTLRYEGRHTRMLAASSAWTLTDTDLQALTVPSSRDDILNTVRVVIHPKVVDADPTTIVYNQANVIEIEPGASKMLLGEFRDPVTGDPIGATDIQPITAYTDYTASRDSATGDDRTTYMDASFGLTVGQNGARFLASHSHVTTLYLTKLQLRGRGIYDHGTVRLEATNAASVLLYGEHAVEFDMPYQANDDVGRGAADYLLAKYKDTFAQVRTITVLAQTPAQLLQVLQRDISDRLTISETVTGVNAAFFINGVDLRVLPTRHLEVTYTLAPAADPFNGLYWVLGTSTLGTDTTPAPF